jgi:flagellar biosynthesis protein FlhF
MQPKRFRGSDMGEAMAKVRHVMGEDAMVLSTRTGATDGARWVEIVAATAADVEEYRARMAGPKVEAKLPRGRIGPRVLALVGPAGSGKTLTAVKLALSHDAFGKGKVGFLTLDTYRVGAVNELQTYAEIAGIPLEVVYNRKEIPAALQRLRSCETIVVDTPGRVPGAMGVTAPWEALLRELKADEVHLVIPAGLRPDVARYISASFQGLGITHVLPSKLDLVLGDAGLAELVEQVRLPTRWVADGQEVPGDLRPAGTRILSSLGQAPQGRLKDSPPSGSDPSDYEVRAG